MGIEDVGNLIGQFKGVALFAPAAAWAANILLNILTSIWPSRPKWFPPIGCAVLGVLSVFVFAKALGVVFDEATYYQILIVGLVGGAGAWASDASKHRADDARTDDWSKSEEGQKWMMVATPRNNDPETPVPNYHPSYPAYDPSRSEATTPSLDRAQANAELFSPSTDPWNAARERTIEEHVKRSQSDT